MHAGGLSGMWTVPATSIRTDRGNGWRRQPPSSGTPGLAACVDLFRRAASVHLLGGGYVNNVWPYQVSLVSAAAALARSTGARARTRPGWD